MKFSSILSAKKISKIITFIFLGLSLSCVAQTWPAEINDYQIECSVDRNGKLTETHHLFLQINNPIGREQADIRISYRENNEIEFKDVRILDKNGEVVRTFKNKEITDHASLTGFFYTDSRYKEINAHHNEYPYVIELKYTKEADAFLMLPYWLPQFNSNIFCHKSSYQITVPEDYSFHYKCFNFSASEKSEINDGKKTYIFQTENVKPTELNEPFSPPIEKIYPYALFAPDNFKMGGISGSMTAWKDFGNWNSKLINGLDDLPETEVEKVKSLVKNAQSDKEKVKILYEYLQNETRYVGVFIGIGGWKPFSATHVCENKFGDCKGLTNYMKSLLKAAGIKSYYSLINASEDEADIDATFVGNWFNHVVLCVPLQDETLWLECTDQYYPFGYWGSFTNGKTALVCDFENSYLVQTPTFSQSDNFIKQTTDVFIIDSQLQINVARQLAGEAYEEIKILKRYKDRIEDQAIAEKTLPFKNYQIQNIQYDFQDSDAVKICNEQAQLLFPNHVQKLGNQLLVKSFSKTFKFENRVVDKKLNPIFIVHNYRFENTINYHIPEDYFLDELPENIQISNEMGFFDIQFKLQNDMLVIELKVILNKGTYAAENYPKFKYILKAIETAENQKFLFTKK
uniref:DUF3857 domain-containing protein n=2 Tax=Flavobacterium sp. TaxID=239 RepID=UPI0040494348